MRIAWLLVAAVCTHPARQTAPPAVATARDQQPAYLRPRHSPQADLCPPDVPAPYGDGGHIRLASLERTRCPFGQDCAAYTVVLYRDGVVSWFGAHYVATCGADIGRVSPSDVTALEQQFITAGFLAYPDRFDGPQDPSDLPSATVSYQPLNAPEKSVYHYYGHTETPDQLLALEHTLDNVLDTAQWIGTSGHIPTPLGAY